MLKPFLPHLNSTGESKVITNVKVCREDDSFQLAATELIKAKGLFSSLKWVLMWKTSCFSFLSKIRVFLVHLEMAFVIFSEWAWYFYLPNFNNFKWNSAFTSTDLLLQTHSFWGVYGTSLGGHVGPVVFWVIGQLYGSSQQSDQIMVVTTPPAQAVSSSIGNYGNHNSNYQLGVVVKIGVVFPLSKEHRAFWGADILCGHPGAYCCKICGAESNDAPSYKIYGAGGQASPSSGISCWRVVRELHLWIKHRCGVCLRFPIGIVREREDVNTLL